MLGKRKHSGKPFTKDDPRRCKRPPGRAPLPPEVREAQKLTVEEHIRIVTDILNWTPVQLVNFTENLRQGTVQQHLIASILRRGILEGKTDSYERIFDRVIGRVALPITGKDGKPLIPDPKIDTSKLTTEVLIKLAKMGDE